MARMFEMFGFRSFVVVVADVALDKKLMARRVFEMVQSFVVVAVVVLISCCCC